LFALPHAQFTAAGLLALQDAVVPPFAQIHCHVVVPPAGGNAGLAGLAVPALQNVSLPKPVSVYAYTLLFAVHHAQFTAAGLLAAQLEFIHQFAHRHCHAVLAHCAGNAGLAGLAVPAPHNVSAPNVVMLYAYVLFATPHVQFTAAGLVALQDALPHQFAHRHCHAVLAHCAGNAGNTGFEVPALHIVSLPYVVILYAYVLFAVPHVQTTTAGLLALQLALPHPFAHRHCHVVVAPCAGKLGKTGFDVPALHIVSLPNVVVVYAYVWFALPHVQTTTAGLLAVQDAVVPPFNHTQLQLVVFHCAGNAGLAGVVVPALHIVSLPYVVILYAYVLFALPHAQFTPAGLLAVQDAVVHQLVHRHCHVLIDPCAGNAGLSGFAVHTLHNVSAPNVVAVYIYVLFAVPHAQFVAAGLLEVQDAVVQPFAHRHCHVVLAHCAGKPGIAGFGDPALHIVSAPNVVILYA